MTSGAQDDATPRPEGYWVTPFLESLRAQGLVGLAADRVGIAPSTAYRRRKKDPKFAEKWDDAILRAREIAVLEARRRAIAGVEKPVYYKGKVVGKITEYSDTLLKTLLAGYFDEFRSGSGYGQDEKVTPEDIANAVAALCRGALNTAPLVPETGGNGHDGNGHDS